MVLAIVCGLLSGIIGFIPLILGLRLTKKMTKATNFGHMGVLFLFMFLSFVFLFGVAIAYIMVDRDSALFFAMTEAVGLCGAAIVFGIRKTFGDKGKRSR